MKERCWAWIVRCTFVAASLAAAATFSRQVQAQEAMLSRADVCDAIVQAAARTSSCLQRGEGATWTAEIRAPGMEGVIELTRQEQGQNSAWELTVRTKQQAMRVVRVVARDGLWYVQEGGDRYKCRPYEASIGFPATYTYLVLTDLRVVQDPIALGEPVVREGSTVQFRQKLEGPLRRQMETLLQQYQSVLKAHPERPVPPELRQTIAQLEDICANGQRCIVDTEAGVLTELCNPKFTITYRNVRVGEHLDKSVFNVPGSWRDETEPLVSDDMSDIVMLAHLKGWRPEFGKLDGDTHLVNVRTGKSRRVPFAGSSMPGGFSSDRKSVVLCGPDLVNGDGMRPFRVDLQTGQRRPLGGQATAGAMFVGGAVSADGKLVVATKLMQAGLLKMGIYVMDPEGGEARQVGEAMDAGPVSWCDGNQLIFERREEIDLTQPGSDGSRVPKGTICRMDLNGHVRELVAGKSPVVLDGKTILFEDENRVPMTCDLNGEHVAKWDGGSPTLFTPAPSPDGKRVLMMRLNASREPRPMILEDGKVFDVPVAQGLWMMPVWK